MASSQAEIRQRITNEIIKALEDGGLPPWRQPWTGLTNTGMPANVLSRRAYRGVNPLLLTKHQRRHGFRSRWYATYNQWRELGAKIMRRPDDVPPGEWGCSVIYYSPIVKTIVDQTTGEETEERYPLLKTYSVFCVDQVEGEHLDYLRAANEGPLNLAFTSFAPADQLIAATEAKIRYTETERAFYCSADDYIQMPPKSRFRKEADFYATTFHELAGHWTEQRVGWKGSYAEGELRAEIASAYVLAELGVPQSEDLTNHQAYLQTWLQALRNNSHFLFKSSTAASRAVDYVMSFARQPDLEEVPF